MDIRLDSKVALVTGTSRGIGQELVRQLARSRAKVVFCACRTASLRTLDEEIRREGFEVNGITADVTRPEEVAGLVGKAIDRYGRMDVLIDNVGIAGPHQGDRRHRIGRLESHARRQSHKHIFVPACRGPADEKNGNGSVVNIGSATG